MKALVMGIGIALGILLLGSLEEGAEARTGSGLLDTSVPATPSGSSTIPVVGVGMRLWAVSSASCSRPVLRCMSRRPRTVRGRRRRGKRRRQERMRGPIRVRPASAQSPRRGACIPSSSSDSSRACSEKAASSPRIKSGTTHQWVSDEVKTAHLGDTRLDRRLHILVEQCADHPTASIPEACGDWASTKAAYRFFSNEKVTHPAILAAHRSTCLERVADESFLLVVQDTTSFDFTDHSYTTDLGPLEHAHRRGFFVHTGLAVNLQGVPLGILDQRIWSRDPDTVGKTRHRKELPIEQKESYKWLQTLRASLVDVSREICVVTVADREADVFDLFTEAEKQHTHLLIRSAWKRKLTDPPDTYLPDAVAQTPVRGRLEVEVRRSDEHLPRRATCALRFTPVTVNPPKHRLRESGLHPIPLYAVEVREEHTPQGATPLHWLLLTTMSVTSFDDAQRCVQWYQYRWLVERYHFVLKSGCHLEDRQLRKRARLERCLGVYAIVAWRLLWLTYRARATPNVSCTVALDTPEWQALYCYIHKTPIPPTEPPTLHQAIRWIAQLGGFLGRKSDGEPGVKVLWRGWIRLDTITQSWLLFHPPQTCG